MGKYIGIDLGTTYSAAAYIDDSGNPQIIPNSDGGRTTPSAVLFEDGNAIVGEDAKKESITSPEHFVAFAKRSMGSNSQKWHIDNEDYRPETISAIVLKKIKEDCEAALGDTVDGAVITVPAYFTDLQRTATKDAAHIAGINVLSIINEPTAAALAYGLTKDSADRKRILVFDLGGGTFDVSIMEFKNDNIEILSSMGDSMLGGYDFDKEIVEWFAAQARAQGVDVHEDTDALQSLWISAEDAKKALSSGKSKTKITVYVMGKKISAELLKEEFESMIEPYLTGAMGFVDASLDEADLEYENIDKILLIGGSTRIPMVKETIKEWTGIAPSQDINPDEAVAIGAAYYVLECAKRQNEPEVSRTSGVPVSAPDDLPELDKSYTFTDRTSHGIGIEAVNEYGESINSVIIPKNSVLPAEATNVYQTVSDYQTELELIVRQGEDEDLRATTKIGNTILKLQPKPMGYPIEVTISCDIDAIIHVHVFDAEDNLDLGEMNIDRTVNMSQPEMEKAQIRVGKLNIGGM